MNDSLQYVHSSPSGQITGIRGLVSSACTIWGPMVASSPRAAPIIVQNFRKLRRSTPCWVRTSYVEGRRNGSMSPLFREAEFGQLRGLLCGLHAGAVTKITGPSDVALQACEKLGLSRSAPEPLRHLFPRRTPPDRRIRFIEAAHKAYVRPVQHSQ